MLETAIILAIARSAGLKSEAGQHLSPGSNAGAFLCNFLNRRLVHDIANYSCEIQTFFALTICSLVESHRKSSVRGVS